MSDTWNFSKIKMTDTVNIFQFYNIKPALIFQMFFFLTGQIHMEPFNPQIPFSAWNYTLLSSKQMDEKAK